MFRTILLIATALLGLISQRSSAQVVEPYDIDPAAARAFAELVESYRARDALNITAILKLELDEGDARSVGEEVEAEFLYRRENDKTYGVVRLRGFTCFVGDESFHATHDSTAEHSFFRDVYEDYPYWTFFNAFRDVPYPHLAILFGSAEMEDLYMELYPNTPMIVPTSVEDLSIDDRPIRRITLSSPNAVMHMNVSQESNLIIAIEQSITGGPFVQPGVTMITRLSYEYDDQPDVEKDATAFDRGDRQPVDMIAALVEQAPMETIQPAGGGGGAMQPVGALVGQEAPGFVLATADGDVVDLEDLEGQVVVLDFWATWCGPCRQALPLLHDVAAWADEQQLPVKVITINVWENKAGDGSPDARLEAATTFWKTNGFTLPIAMDYSDETAAAYGLTGIPTTVIIRSDGIVHAQHAGAGADYVQQLQSELLDAITALEAPD